MLSFSRKISCCQSFCYYIAQVLIMCLPCALASWAPALGLPCALACWAMGISRQPSWISSFYIFWYVQFEVDLGVPNKGKLSLIPINIKIFPEGCNGKLQIYKIIFKIYGLWFQNTLFIQSRFILVIFSLF